MDLSALSSCLPSSCSENRMMGVRCSATTCSLTSVCVRRSPILTVGKSNGIVLHYFRNRCVAEAKTLLLRLILIWLVCAVNTFIADHKLIFDRIDGANYAPTNWIFAMKRRHTVK